MNKELTYQARMAWFHEARFGMFIHFGLYALPACGEWSMFLARTPLAEYEKLADQFQPAADCVSQWIETAKNAGMKYAVLTARHHDGFCLYDSAYSDYSTSKTACGRDLVREFCTACRAAGIRVGIYYSLMDWRFPGYFNYKTDQDSLIAMKKQCHDQVQELMSNYGRIDLLWYDGCWLNHEPDTCAGAWDAAELNQKVRSLQPHIIINNRAGTQEDIDTPEQVVRHSGQGRGWETCMTIGKTWGYSRYASPDSYKTSGELIHHLVDAASGEGNYLLNVGPDQNGYIPAIEKERLLTVGQWIKRYGASIYNSKRADLKNPFFGMWTRVGEYYYLQVKLWCGRSLPLPLLDGEVAEAVLMATGEKLKVDYATNGRLIFSALPEEPPDPYLNVIRLKFKQTPRDRPETDPAAWLLGKA